MKAAIRITGVAIAGFLALAGPAIGGGPSLAMLNSLEPGQWEVRTRESGTVPQRMCLSNGQALLQLRHPGPACERFVIEGNASEVVVQYTCRGRGYGRTEIRRETGRLVQIDSRGIANGLPFEFSAEARRIGNCGGT
ncbi:MAG: DUF3617 domain-containing protein [Alphaproteobacteria bacterium]